MKMTKQKTRWIKIANWPYFVSEHGDVKHTDGYLRKLNTDKAGYKRINLLKAPKKGQIIAKSFYVHRLVITAFVGKRPSKKYFVAHYDGVKANNHYSNLRWATAKENGADKVRLGEACRGEDSPKSKLTEKQVLAIRKDTRSQEKIAAAYGVRLFAIQNILHRRSWKHI